jgi:hypothetical protein
LLIKKRNHCIKLHQQEGYQIANKWQEDGLYVQVIASGISWASYDKISKAFKIKKYIPEHTLAVALWRCMGSL